MKTKKNLKFKIGLLGLLLALPLAITATHSEASVKAWSGPQTSNEGSYYSSVGNETGSALKGRLKSIISSNVSTSYDWSRYEAADEAEGEPSKVLQIYSRKTISKSMHVSGSSGWNREHSYPQSKIGSPATSDNHHIFASDNRLNSIRSNNRFGVVAKNSGNQVEDSTGALTDNYSAGGYFMPNSLAQGEVARATMYLNTLYDYSVTGNFASVELMLEWHVDNPVTNREIYRNNKVHSLQDRKSVV